MAKKQQSPMLSQSPRSSFEEFQEEEKGFKPNRPEDTDWAQQRLKLWKPLLTLPYAIGTLLSIAVVFIAVGTVVTVQSRDLDVYRVEYDGENVKPSQPSGQITNLTNCLLNDPEDSNSFSAEKTCFIDITIEQDNRKDYLVFYELDKFYQNHRRYVTSLQPTQFIDQWKIGDGTAACEPVLILKSKSCSSPGRCDDLPYTDRELFPCGIVANTMFNDIFWLDKGILPNGEVLGREDMVQDDIAREYLNNKIANPSFKLPENDFLPIWNNPNYSLIIPPPNGTEIVVSTTDYHHNTAWSSPPKEGGLLNEHWRVWIEIAATSRFRKPYGRIKKFLPKGTKLRFAVQSNFFVRSFGGTKAIVVAQVTWFGSENFELGSFFIIIGLVCLVAGLIFLHRKCTDPRKLGDASSMSWKSGKTL